MKIAHVSFRVRQNSPALSRRIFRLISPLYMVTSRTTYHTKLIYIDLLPIVNILPGESGLRPSSSAFHWGCRWCLVSVESCVQSIVGVRPALLFGEEETLAPSARHLAEQDGSISGKAWTCGPLAPEARGRWSTQRTTNERSLPLL